MKPNMKICHKCKRFKKEQGNIPYIAWMNMEHCKEHIASEGPPGRWYFRPVEKIANDCPYRLEHMVTNQ